MSHLYRVPFPLEFDSIVTFLSFVTIIQSFQQAYDDEFNMEKT